jgi:uncharacterized membrane protein
MDKEIVIVVSNENAAYEVVKALKALDVEGSIELYASTVVYKAENGTFTVVDEQRLRAPRTAALAAATGALLGLLGGPIALAAGATAGAAAGAAAVGAALGGTVGGAATIGGDLTYSGFVREFVHTVAAILQPGSYAVLASVAEDWAVPIDTAVAPWGAVVFRQATDRVVLAQIKADWQSMNDELDHIEAEIDTAGADEKAKLVAKRDELRMKHKAKREKLEARVRALQESWDAKITAMEAKVEVAEARAAARHAEHARKLSQFAAVQKKAFHDLFA